MMTGRTTLFGARRLINDAIVSAGQEVVAEVFKVKARGKKESVRLQEMQDFLGNESGDL